MPLVLCRVDDRLVHGQVIVGWGRPLRAERIVLVDDTVAESPWEQDLYRMALPAGIVLEVLGVAAACAALTELAADARRTLLVTGDLPSMRALHLAAPAVVHEINLGGLHHAPGRRERLPYLFLSDDELRDVRALAAAGAHVRAQDVPTATAVSPEAIA
jgi:mannose/fructose/N-acetylgalactosamine-specific phosphotransferase system component IIB